MSIEVIPALITDKSIIQRMMELFRHDLSEFEGLDIDEHGYFGYPYLTILEDRGFLDGFNYY